MEKRRLNLQVFYYFALKFHDHLKLLFQETYFSFSSEVGSMDLPYFNKISHFFFDCDWFISSIISRFNGITLLSSHHSVLLCSIAQALPSAYQKRAISHFCVFFTDCRFKRHVVSLKLYFFSFDSKG